MTWNYIAGFFDGEGSLVHNGKGFRITISQTNKEVLDKIKIFATFGHIIETKRRKDHWKDNWVYYIARQKDILKFLEGVLPFLIVKNDLVVKIIPQLKIIVKNQQRRKNILKNRIRKAKELRAKGLTYRQIGKIMKIDFGHVRRMSLK